MVSDYSEVFLLFSFGNFSNPFSIFHILFTSDCQCIFVFDNDSQVLWLVLAYPIGYFIETFVFWQTNKKNFHNKDFFIRLACHIIYGRNG